MGFGTITDSDRQHCVTCSYEHASRSADDARRIAFEKAQLDRKTFTEIHPDAGWLKRATFELFGMQ